MDLINKIMRLLGIRDVERDVALHNTSMQIQDQLWRLPEYSDPWVTDIMFSEEGPYAVFNDNGKLYKVMFNVASNGADIELGDIRQVKVDIVEVENERAITVYRAKDGSLKWSGIAAVAVLNRSGEIDTTNLLDDFENNYDVNTYRAYLGFHHLPEGIAFGTVEGVARVGRVLLAWGNIDESTVLGRKAEERFASGEWGLSITFKPDVKGMEIVEIDGIPIRTFVKGRLIEISVLKENRAASPFTTIGVIDRENRMGKTKEQAKQLLLEFAGDESEDAIEKLLEEVSLRERTIDEEGLISRDQEEDAKDEAEEKNEEEQKEEVKDEAEKKEIEFNVDDELLDELSNRVVDILLPRVENMIAERFNKSEDRIEELTRSIASLTERVEQRELEAQQERERIDALSQSDEEKVQNAIDDLPAASHNRITVNYRPTRRDVGEEPIKTLDDGRVAIRKDYVGEQLGKMATRFHNKGTN